MINIRLVSVYMGPSPYQGQSLYCTYIYIYCSLVLVSFKLSLIIRILQITLYLINIEDILHHLSLSLVYHHNHLPLFLTWYQSIRFVFVISYIFSHCIWIESVFSNFSFLAGILIRNPLNPELKSPWTWRIQSLERNLQSGIQSGIKVSLVFNPEL